MKQSEQITDSKQVLSFVPKRIDSSINNQTMGNDIHGYSWLHPSSSLMVDTISTARDIEDPNIKDEALKLLHNIQNTLKFLDFHSCDLNLIPPMHAHNNEDGTFITELVSKNYRIGFNIEKENIESSWYLVTKGNLGEIDASGYLAPNINQNKLILWLLLFPLMEY